MKKIISTLILFAALFIVLTNCEKNEIVYVEPKAQIDPIIERLNIYELTRDQTFNQIKEELKLDKVVDFNDGISKSSTTKLEIHKSSVKKLTYENYVSYTFILKRKIYNENIDFENLIIEKRDTTFKAHIISFDRGNELNVVEFKAISNGEIDIDNIIRKSSNCYTFELVKTWCSANVHYGWDPDCKAETKGESIFVVESKPCSIGGSYMDGNDGTGSIGSGIDTNNETIISPNDPLYYDALAESLAEMLSLDQLQTQYLAANPDGITDRIKAFLEQYAWMPETVVDELAVQAVNNVMSFTSSFYPGKNDGLPFKWWIDENFIENSGNLNIPADAPNAPAEKPNAVEVFLFGLFPDEALKHIANSLEAMGSAQTLAYQNQFGEGSAIKSLNNGKSDAFRHAFWNALGTASFGSTLTKLFTDAHEFGESGIDSEMDLFNNEKGRVIAKNNNYNSTTNHGAISGVVLTAVYNGVLEYLFPTGPNGEIITGTTQRVPTN